MGKLIFYRGSYYRKNLGIQRKYLEKGAEHSESSYCSSTSFERRT